MVKLIALRAPMADDLREAIAALKIAGVIERIGDYAKNIAKRVPHDPRRGAGADRAAVDPAGDGAVVAEWSRRARRLCRARSGAREVCLRDAAVDDFYNSMFRALLTNMMENPQTISQSTHLLFVAKNLERIGDHATNIAEMVYYAATGEHLADAARRDFARRRQQ